MVCLTPGNYLDSNPSLDRFKFYLGIMLSKKTDLTLAKSNVCGPSRFALKIIIYIFES